MCLVIVSQIVSKAFCCEDWYSYRADDRKRLRNEYRQHRKENQNEHRYGLQQHGVLNCETVLFDCWSGFYIL